MDLDPEGCDLQDNTSCLLCLMLKKYIHNILFGIEVTQAAGTDCHKAWSHLLSVISRQGRTRSLWTFVTMWFSAATWFAFCMEEIDR